MGKVILVFAILAMCVVFGVLLAQQMWASLMPSLFRVSVARQLTYLTEIQKKAIERYFDNHVLRCSVCNADNWEIPDRLHELPEFSLSRRLVSGKYTYPILVLCCNECGNTVMFIV